jgi:predicted ferric reductase
MQQTDRSSTALGAPEWLMVLLCGFAGIGVAMVAVEVLPLATSVTVGAHTWWYGARAAGMMAYVLSTLSVAFGIAISARAGKFIGKANVAETHRVLSLLSLFAIGAHTLFLSLDQYANFGLRDLAVPFATWYKPFWTGLGIIAAYLAASVYASVYLRSFIGYKAWRAFHFLAFAVFAMGTLHGIFAGTDTGAAWALAIYGGGTALVPGLLAYRIGQVRQAKAARPVRRLESLKAAPSDA